MRDSKPSSVSVSYRLSVNARTWKFAASAMLRTEGSAFLRCDPKRKFCPSREKVLSAPKAAAIRLARCSAGIVGRRIRATRSKCSWVKRASLPRNSWWSSCREPSVVIACSVEPALIRVINSSRTRDLLQRSLFSGVLARLSAGIPLLESTM